MVRQRPSHQASVALQALAGQFENRRTLKIKDCRNVIVALLGTQKPWEVLVGQLLASHGKSSATSDHSIAEYLGPGYAPEDTGSVRSHERGI